MNCSRPHDQKSVFIASEGDAWYERNRDKLVSRDFSDDPIAQAVTKIIHAANTASTTRLIEIGCGDGRRLQWLKENLGVDAFGIEPSIKAVESASDQGIKVDRGTADSLPFGDREFDILIFGFCLYLCDSGDLFKIASEADRVLKDTGWIVILDFHSGHPKKREYHHRAGLFSRKMDYRRLFDWHPAYTCYEHVVTHHGSGRYSDEPDEWVALSVLRKHGEH